MHVYYMNMDVYICVIHTVYDTLVKYVKNGKNKTSQSHSNAPFPQTLLRDHVFLLSRISQEGYIL